MKPVVLIVLDGWGIAPQGPGNAVALTKTPNFTRYQTVYPHTQLQAAGEMVGLPKGEDGNSEVGHLNLGAGRIVYQDLPRINMAIADGTFLRKPPFVKALEHVKENNSKLHLLGLIGPGVVHSSIEHLYALLWVVREYALPSDKLFLHLFTDGRDSPPTSSLQYIGDVEGRLNEMRAGKIASISGRYYAMDRDKNWERTEKAYRVIAEGKGIKIKDVSEYIETSYTKNITDEFIEPAVVVDLGGNSTGRVENNDAVIFFNYRSDRARQLTKAFIAPEFKPFPRESFITNLFFVTMTEYEKGLPVSGIAFQAENVKMPLAEVLANADLRQLHITETEKYAHVTYFFNGGREDPFRGEDRILIPSPEVETFDLKPEMSSYQITEIVCQKLMQKIYDFIIVNFAAPDMVSHTGKIEAAVKALEAVDECLGRIVNTVLGLDGGCVITADHGNAEELINLISGRLDTEHSANPVPLVIVSNTLKTYKRYLQMGILGDVAPTILGLLGIRKPLEMAGRDLLK